MAIPLIWFISPDGSELDPEGVNKVPIVDPLELRTVLGLVGNELYPEDWYVRTCNTAAQTLVEYLGFSSEDGEGGFLIRVPPDLENQPGQFWGFTNALQEAGLAIAVDIWQARAAPGGAIQGVDFQPGPYRLGRGLMARVWGIFSPYIDTGSMVG